MSLNDYAGEPVEPWRIAACLVAATIALLSVMVGFGEKQYEPPPVDDWSE